jgi:hypothetical protein
MPGQSSVRPWLAIALLALVPSARGVAQTSPNHLYDRFQASASGTLLVLGATIRIDGENRGTELNIEDDLGLERSTLQPRLAFRWRPGGGRRHELEANYQWATRENGRVLADTIVVRDTTFAAGLRVNSSFGTSQAGVTYRWAFSAKENSQIGLGVGLGVIFLRTSIDAVAGATPGGPDTAIVQRSSSADLNGPVGSLGVYGRWRLGDRWYLDSDLRGVYVKISNFRAGVLEAGLAGRYFFSDKFGAELGYGLGIYAVRLDREGTDEGGFAGIDVTGRIRYYVHGFRIGGLYAF